MVKLKIILGVYVAFFKADVSKELKEKIFQFQNEKIAISNNLQREINEFYNFLAYQTHQGDAEIKAIINVRENQAAPFRDKSNSDIQAGFTKNYAAELFELAMFDLLQPFTLVKRPHLQISQSDRKSTEPDFVFVHDSNDLPHQFECTATSPGRFDEYLKLLQEFDKYYVIAELIYAKRHRFPNNNVFWECITNIVLDGLTENEEKQVTNMLGEGSFKETKNKFLLWVSIIRHASVNYRDFISTEKTDLLNKVAFPLGSEAGDETDDQRMIEFMTKRIAYAVLDKLTKKYCHLGNPVTLGISISLIKPTLGLPNPQYLLDYLRKNLMKCLLELSLAEKYRQENLSKSIDNLYAIILDTCWYNWFPQIAVERFNAKFPQGFNNCYACIYNSDHPLVQKGEFIYEHVPYFTEVSFASALIKPHSEVEIS